MTLGDHLEELRRRLIRAVIGAAVGMVIAFVFLEWALKVLFWPLGVATAGAPPNLYYRTLAGSFNVYIRLGIYAGLILSSPYTVYQIWQFVAAGLYPNERRFVGKCVLPSVGLFLLGVVFFLLVVAPIMVRWFLTFGAEAFPAPPPWGPDWFYKFVSGSSPASQPATQAFVLPWLDVDEYISFIASMSLAFGLSFQVPLVVFALIRTNLVDLKTLKGFRRYVLALTVLASAIITPTGDAFTMLAMALPMYLLYELGLLVGGRGRTKEPAG